MDKVKNIEMNVSQWEQLLDKYLTDAFHLGVNLVICIVIYVVGRKLIKWLDGVIKKVMTARNFDQSVSSFLRSLVNVLLTVALLMMIVTKLGIETTSFVALLASFGVAAGMAMSGTLQNLAGGVMILLFRPYDVGDYIEAQSFGGTVKAIQIFNTVIITSDNRTVYIPNGILSANTIVNFNDQTNRRIEWVIGIDYGTEYDKAKGVIQQLLDADKRIQHDPLPLIAVKELNQSSVDIVIRAWVQRADYWDVYFDINEQIYKTFVANGIDIPFPQLTVHLADTNGQSKNPN
ncbi:MAG: mechanosensitive ion channel [Candidatus Symbiothrix sp.]|jgi:small conductance mechanosensitive channel|nr:mechanosensitive ion channel [Candidatus Symbiothrix sp.]